MTDRVGLRLPGLPPDLTLASAEEGEGDTWRIDYEWELSQSEAITFMVSASKIEGLVKQAEDLAKANNRPFSVAEARRGAADTVVVQEILTTIRNDSRLARWRL